MRNPKNLDEVDEPTAADRLAISFLSAGLGFLSGMIIWFATPRAFDISFSLFIWLSVILAAVFALVGFFRPTVASQTLGNLWDAVSVINRKIFFWIKLIK